MSLGSSFFQMFEIFEAPKKTHSTRGNSQKITKKGKNTHRKMLFFNKKSKSHFSLPRKNKKLFLNSEKLPHEQKLYKTDSKTTTIHDLNFSQIENDFSSDPAGKNSKLLDHQNSSNRDIMNFNNLANNELERGGNGEIVGEAGESSNQTNVNKMNLELVQQDKCLSDTQISTNSTGIDPENCDKMGNFECLLRGFEELLRGF